MKVAIVQVPYHLGKKATGMGLGPIHIMKSNLVQNLLDQGIELKIESLQPVEISGDEITAVVELNTLLKSKVKRAISEEYFPLIIGGDCNNSCGIMAGLDSPRTGIIWIDAHGDFNTPETTPSGFFDGMPFAVVTGQCHRDLWSRIADIPPVEETKAMHLGWRDLDPEEKRNLENSKVKVVSTAAVKEGGLEKSLLPALEELKPLVNGIYLHIDIDIVDPEKAPGVNYRTPGGFSVDEMKQIINMISENLPIKAAALTAYNPDNDDEDRKTLEVGVQLLTAITGAVSNNR